MIYRRNKNGQPLIILLEYNMVQPIVFLLLYYKCLGNKHIKCMISVGIFFRISIRKTTSVSMIPWVNLSYSAENSWKYIVLFESEDGASWWVIEDSEFWSFEQQWCKHWVLLYKTSREHLSMLDRTLLKSFVVKEKEYFIRISSINSI